MRLAPGGPAAACLHAPCGWLVSDHSALSRVLRLCARSSDSLLPGGHLPFAPPRLNGRAGSPRCFRHARDPAPAQRLRFHGRPTPARACTQEWAQRRKFVLEDLACCAHTLQQNTSWLPSQENVINLFFRSSYVAAAHRRRRPAANASEPASALPACRAFAPMVRGLPRTAPGHLDRWPCRGAAP